MCWRFSFGVLNRRSDAQPKLLDSTSFFQKIWEDTNQTDLLRYGRCESFTFWKASMMLAVQLAIYARSQEAGHRGVGDPMMVGVGCTQREMCGGQSLASPGRWPPGSRVYPSSAH